MVADMKFYKREVNSEEKDHLLKTHPEAHLMIFKRSGIGKYKLYMKRFQPRIIKKFEKGKSI